MSDLGFTVGKLETKIDMILDFELREHKRLDTRFDTLEVKVDNLGVRLSGHDIKWARLSAIGVVSGGVGAIAVEVVSKLLS